MKPHFKIFSAFVLLLSAACTPSDELAVRNKGLEIRWEQTAEGWKISRIADRKGRCWGVPDGAYTILFSSEKPSAEPETITNRGGDTMNFDIARFHYIAKDFNRAVSSVPMNRAGEALRFYPEKGWKEGRAVCFEARNELGRLRTTWSPDPDYPADIRIESVFYPARKGYYSVSTPTLAVLPEERLGWSVVPGFFQGDYIQPVFHLAYMYGQGLPHLPVICNDNTVTTMITSMTEKAGNTLALIPDSGYSRSEYSGGISNADKSLIKHDSDNILVWNRQELNASSDAVELRVQFRVITEYVAPNYENVYPDDITKYMEPISWDAHFGESYFITITGDKTNGYKVTLK